MTVKFKSNDAKRQWELVISTIPKPGNGTGLVVFMYEWAEQMEAAISQGRSLAEVHEEMRAQARDISLVSSVDELRAEELLPSAWLYGDELKPLLNP